MIRRDGWIAVAASVAVVAVVGALVVHAATTRQDRAEALHVGAGPAGPSVATLTGYQWHVLPTAPIGVRSGAAAVWTGRTMIVWGGMDRTEHEFGDGAIYDPKRRSWSVLPRSPLSPRSYSVAAWVDGSFVVWGGSDGRTVFTDGARYDLARRAWTMLPGLPDATPSRSTVLVSGGGEAILVRAPAGERGRAIRVDSYRPGDRSWRTVPSYETGKHHFVHEVHALAVNGAILVWGAWAYTVKDSPHGTRTTIGTESASLRIPAGTWTATRVGPDAGLSADQAQLLDGRVLLPQDQRWCGYCPGPPMFAISGLLINAATAQRRHVPPNRAAVENGHFVSTATFLLALNTSAEVSGSGGTRPGEFGVWDPRTDRWKQLPAAPRPMRSDPAIVWTGDRLLVWGGGAFDGPSRAASGLEFSPSR